MEDWIKLELKRFNQRIVIEPKDKKISYGDISIQIRKNMSKFSNN